MLAHNQISLSYLYKKSSIPTRIDRLLACIGKVVHDAYTTGTCALPDICAGTLEPHRLSTQACGVSIAYVMIYLSEEG